MHDHFEMPPTKRQRVSNAGLSRRPSAVHSTAASPGQQLGMEAPTPPPFPRGRESSTGFEQTESRRQSESMGMGPSATSPAVAKPKRVRTGCLTCRNRHLKCDEAMPVCMNCQKSNRKCERGVRLNFIDLKVEQPPILLPPVDWKVQFQDESRLIASEYVGGLARYAKLDQKPVTPPTEEAGAGPRHRRQGVPVPPTPGHFIETSRAVPLAPAQAIYYPDTLPRPIQEQAFTPYEDQMTQTESRKRSDAFLAISGPTPASSHSGHGGRAASFSMGAMHGGYGMRDETAQMIHGYRSSDGSSVASSLVPQGVASSSSGSYRHATGSGPHDPHDGGLMTPQSEKNGERDYLNTKKEIQFMQVFIDKVAIWMDSLDSQKHFGRVIPYLALGSPMLLNAFLACGVKHLTLVDGCIYKDDKALHYYDTATTQLLRNLQNPERDTAECATTAVVLNVYEVMSEKPAAKKNHIAGARALIHECKWNAKSKGIGAACFWLNVGMEVLGCLASNWAMAWDPDEWGIDPDELMNMTPDFHGREGRIPNANDAHHMIGGGAEDFLSPTSNMLGLGDEDTWVHRILYITAKVANFRANHPLNIPQFQEPSPHEEQVKLQSRFAEWQRLKDWCDMWNLNCPRSMRPYGYLFATSTDSVFPNVWYVGGFIPVGVQFTWTAELQEKRFELTPIRLIKRAAIVGRLFYHTAMCLLAQINPLKHPHHDDDETRTVQLHHAHQVCGIVAHTQDQGVSTVAIRSLAVVGCVLTDHRQQDEVLAILDRIYHNTGWNLKKVVSELRKAWGWDPPDGTLAGGGSLPGGGATLPAPTPGLPTVPAGQGGTLGVAEAGATMMSQHFGPRESIMHAEYARRPSQSHPPPPPPPPPPPQPLLPQVSPSSFPSAVERHRQFSLASNPCGPGLASHAMFSSASTAINVGSNNNTDKNNTSSSSGQPSPADTVNTPGSVSSTVANAATPPSRPTVNPLLAQADFNQPNHPYQEWYKPPEKGMWHY